MFRPSRFRGRSRELLFLTILSLLRKHSNKQTERKWECRLDEHLTFTGKTSDQRNCSRSALTEAYVEKGVAGKMGSTNKYQYHPTSAGEKSNALWDGLVDLWKCGRFIASTWLGLRHARLKVVVLQLTVASRFGCFVFEFWVLRFRVLGPPFSSFGRFVFEIWVLCASFSKLPISNCKKLFPQTTKNSQSAK